MDGEFIETPCQNFEEVPQIIASTKTVASVPKITRPPLKMASLKDAKAVIEEGGVTIWGQLPDIPYKSEKFGLGFTSGAQKVVRRARARGPPLKISNREVNAVEDDEDSYELEDCIFQTVSGELSNQGLEILSRSHLSHSNLSLYFVGSVILKQFRLLKPCVLPEAQWSICKGYYLISI